MPLKDFLPTIGNLASGILGGLGQSQQAKLSAQIARENTDKTILANKKMAEYQYSKDVEMWNKQNAYNSPGEQMSRLKSAGLNPNLVYGTGATGNTSSQLPKYNAPTLEYNYKPDKNLAALSAFQDMQLRQAQIDNVRQQTKNSITENALKTIDLSYKPYNAQSQYERLWQQKEKSGIDTLEAQRKYQLGRETFSSDLLKRQADAQRVLLDNAMRQIDLNWYKAEKWLGSGTRVINSATGIMGVKKLGGLFHKKIGNKLVPVNKKF